MRRTSSSTMTAMARWTTSTMTARSRSMTRGLFRPLSTAWKPLIPSSSAGQACIRPRPGTDLSFTLTRVAIGRAGWGPQEADVADQRRTSDDSAIAVAETRDGKAVARDAKPDRDAVREIKEVRASDIEPYTGL